MPDQHKDGGEKKGVDKGKNISPYTEGRFPPRCFFIFKFLFFALCFCFSRGFIRGLCPLIVGVIGGLVSPYCSVIPEIFNRESKGF